MVQVIGFNVRKNKQGEHFIALDLMGSLELVQSDKTGKWYGTARKCSIPSTFDEDIARLMVGSKIDGDIVRVPCDPYEYTVKRTGEVISLAYSYSYQPAGTKELIGHGKVEIDEPKAPEKPKDAITASAQRKRNEIAKTK